MPDRYTTDNYYRKGAFHVQFNVAPLESSAPDDDQRRRALQQLLLALRDETGLKISSFVDVWDEDTPADEPETIELDRNQSAATDEAEDEVIEDPEADDSGAPVAMGEFVIYNKLGVTSLAKLRKFMEHHLKGDVNPRVTLIDPKSEQRFRCTAFTIGYLFHDFIAHQPPNDWNRLRELLGSEDRGYQELAAQNKQASVTLKFRGHRYRGPVLERGGTSIQGGAVKPLMDIIQKLVDQGTLVPGESILADIGAGQYSRNATALRKMGFDCYAHDPHHGFDANGWTGVAATLPRGSFDLVFSSYVLNVVPEHIENKILAQMEALSSRVVHVTRNRDVRQMITNAIYRYQDGGQDRNARLVAAFFLDEFADDEALEQYHQGTLYEQDMQRLAQHGVPTSRGFQRIPVLDQKGYQLVRSTGGFKLYTKGL